MGVAIGAAIVAGGFLATTGVLQQRAASARPEGEALSLRLFSSLLRNRLWLLGLAAGVASYAFQAVALAFGPLALVQPIFLSELLFAVPISVRLYKMRLHAREWLGVVTVAAGLGIGVISAWPQPGNPLAPLVSWFIAIGIVAVAAGAAVFVGRRRAQGAVRSSLYAFAAAVVMALQSALLAATVALLKRGVVDVFTAWQSYALVPVTVVGVLLVQSAYQAGPLAASMPVIDASEPSVAIVLGVALFGETIRTAAWNLTGTAIGLSLFFLGIVVLDTSPVVHRLQQKQEKRQEQAGEASEGSAPGDASDGESDDDVARQAAK